MYFPQITCFIYIRPQAIFRDEGVDASDWLTVVWVGGWVVVWIYNMHANSGNVRLCCPDVFA